MRWRITSRHLIPTIKTPVLLADYSQEGGDSWLLANGAILITDPNKAYNDTGCLDTGATMGDCVVDVFALDTMTDGNFDINDFAALTLNYKEVSVLGTDLSILDRGSMTSISCQSRQTMW